MNNVTVRNDSGTLQTFHPLGGQVAAGASLTVDTDVVSPSFSRLLRDSAFMTVTAGSFPADLDARFSLVEGGRTDMMEMIGAYNVHAHGAFAGPPVPTPTVPVVPG